LTGYHDRAPYGGVEQSIATVPGNEYQLSLSLGSNSSYPGAGGQKQVTVSAGLANTVFTFDPPAKETHEWRSFAFVFSATLDTTVIRILGLNPGGGVYLALDNVSVVPAVAIPSLRVEAIRTPGDELRIRFPATAGRSYTLESRADFAVDRWISLPVSALDNGDGTRQITLPMVRSTPQRFYRVREGP
jgi:hypothetical protein